MTKPSVEFWFEFVRRVYLANFRDDADTTSNDVVRGVLQSMALPAYCAGLRSS
jgi:hypothetical protein